MERSGRTARAWRCLSSTKAEKISLLVRLNQLFAGEKLLERWIRRTISCRYCTGLELDWKIVSLVRRFRCGRGGEFLETRIVPERIEHRIEPEQCRSERHAPSQWASVRCRE